MEGATGGRLVYTFRSRPSGTPDGWAKVPVALFGQVSPAAVGLYGALRSFEGHAGTYPKVETIAARAGICHTQVKDYLRVLRRAGAIEVVGRVDDRNRTTSNLYVFPTVAEACQQTHVEAGQGHAAADLVPNPAWGWCQIPPGVGAKSRPQTRTSNKNLEPDLVGWSAPSARLASEETLREFCEELPVSGTTSETTPKGFEEIRIAPEKSQVPLPNSGRTTGWFRQPLDDEASEGRAQDLVDLFAKGHADLGWNTPTPATLQNWLQSARLILDQRDYDDARQLIEKVCADEYWSRQVHDLFGLKRRWDEIADEFTRRGPKDVGVAKAQRRRQLSQARVADQTAAGDGRAWVGTGARRLSSLFPDVEEPAHGTESESHGDAQRDPVVPEPHPRRSLLDRLTPTESQESKTAENHESRK